MITHRGGRPHLISCRGCPALPAARGPTRASSRGTTVSIGTRSPPGAGQGVREPELFAAVPGRLAGPPQPLVLDGPPRKPREDRRLPVPQPDGLPQLKGDQDAGDAEQEQDGRGPFRGRRPTPLAPDRSRECRWPAADGGRPPGIVRGGAGCPPSLPGVLAV